MENAFYIDDKDANKVEPEEPAEINEADTYTPEAYDEYIGAQVMLPYQDGRIQGTITNNQKETMVTPLGGGMTMRFLIPDDTRLNSQTGRRKSITCQCHC
jgi:hypothetical protein